MSEKKLALRHPRTEASVQLLAHIISCNTIEVATDAILTVPLRHENLCVDEVRPPIHLHRHVSREMQVNHSVLQECHSLINQASLVVVKNTGTAAVTNSELVQDPLTIAIDLAQHALDLDFMIIDEGAPDDDGGHRRIICVVILLCPVGSLEPTLHADCRTFHKPEVALTVEHQARLVECPNVRVAPQNALLGVCMFRVTGLSTGTATILFLGITPAMLPIQEASIAIKCNSTGTANILF